MTRRLAVPLDVSDVFIMTFMILQDSYMEPTRVGSDSWVIVALRYRFLIPSWSLRKNVLQKIGGWTH